ncbi:unnamed protein product [Paramecium octaurelia]|uniref:Uncharacterized protein n=1 Tax=Paramecium octaurelia TaxID=43137 RepID=A0A8S1YT16_PAROT|nr:unnamed protein product [Paramecium octaurelia]
MQLKFILNNVTPKFLKYGVRDEIRNSIINYKDNIPKKFHKYQNLQAKMHKYQETSKYIILIAPIFIKYIQSNLIYFQINACNQNSISQSCLRHIFAIILSTRSNFINKQLLFAKNNSREGTNLICIIYLKNEPIIQLINVVTLTTEAQEVEHKCRHQDLVRFPNKQPKILRNNS